MKCSIKELKEGTTYYFLEADACRDADEDGIKIYSGKLKELDKGGRVVSAMFDFEGLEKNEVFFYQPVDNKYTGDLSDEILDKPIILKCNYSDDNSRMILGTSMYPRGFMLSDSVENAINEYKEFLVWSVSEGKKNAQKKIDEGYAIDGETDMYRIGRLAQNYKKQIIWLKKNYLEHETE